jgi:peptidyl-prolyl cis-trans isomerase D
MLNSIRNFSKTLFAKILIVIIIIPFVFWGMGGVFNSGNSNNIAKINNYSISTQDFIDYINKSQIKPETIKKNLENNVLEELLSMLVSEKLLEMEIKDLNIFISDKALVKIIKSNKNFHDDNQKFSRVKYEKFLLSQNFTAARFEKELKKNELKKKLFLYVAGGIKSPFFYANNSYVEENKKIEIEFINLENKYQKKSNFSDIDLNLFINANKDNLKEEYINFSYIKITPKNLTGSNEFNEIFYKKIDEIDNDISKGTEISELSKKLKIKLINKKKFISNKNSDEIHKKIYQKRNENKIQLIDENNFYVLFQIDNIAKILPTLDDLNFKDKIINTLYLQKKYEYNKKIIDKINDKKFNNTVFKEISNGKIKSIELQSIKDDNKFAMDSIKLLYGLPIGSYTLATDKKNNVYLVKVLKINISNLYKNSDLILDYLNRSNQKVKNHLFESFDLLIEEKYEVNVNQKTLERVKNFFR